MNGEQAVDDPTGAQSNAPITTLAEVEVIDETKYVAYRFKKRSVVLLIYETKYVVDRSKTKYIISVNV